MSVVQVMGGGGGGYAGDRTPFFGLKIPPEVRKLAQLASATDQDTLRALLKAVVQYLETGSGNEAALAALRSERCSEEALRSMFSGMHTIVTAALRQPKLKPEVFREDLALAKLPAGLIAGLASFVSGSRRSKLDSCLLESRVRLPRVEGMRWRVDVAISNSSVTRVLEPSILLELTLSSGAIKTFEVPASKFHELRYSVAYVLREMEDLEKKNILKLQD